MAEVDLFTFRKLGDLAKTNPELCERVPFEVVWDNPVPGGEAPFYKDEVGDVSVVPAPFLFHCFRARRLRLRHDGVVDDEVYGVSG